MPRKVKSLHHVTVGYRVRWKDDRRGGGGDRLRRHRFLYGVETWVAGIDPKLEGLAEGETVELSPDEEVLAALAWEPGDEIPSPQEVFAVEVRLLHVEKAEPRAVIKALAAQVRCCDRCEDH